MTFPHCFPFTCLSVMFHLLFFSFLLQRQWRPAAASYFVRTFVWKTTFITMMADVDVRAIDRSIGITLAAASFFDRGTIANCRWCGLWDTLLTGMAHSYACCCILFRTGDRLEACCCILFQMASGRLLLYPFSNVSRWLSLLTTDIFLYFNIYVSVW